MKKDRFPQTKDERLLLGIAEAANKQGSILSWVDWMPVSQKLNFGEKSAANMINILAKTYLLQKKGDLVRLTAVTFRHYGEELTQILGIDLPDFDSV